MTLFRKLKPSTYRFSKAIILSHVAGQTSLAIRSSRIMIMRKMCSDIPRASYLTIQGCSSSGLQTQNFAVPRLLSDISISFHAYTNRCSRARAVVVGRRSRNMNTNWGTVLAPPLVSKDRLYMSAILLAARSLDWAVKIQAHSMIFEISSPLLSRKLEADSSKTFRNASFRCCSDFAASSMPILPFMERVRCSTIGCICCR